MNNYLTEQQVCDWLQLSRSTLWRMRKECDLPFVYIGTRIRYDQQSIANWLDSQKENQSC